MQCRHATQRQRSGRPALARSPPGEGPSVARTCAANGHSDRRQCRSGFSSTGRTVTASGASGGSFKAVADSPQRHVEAADLVDQPEACRGLARPDAPARQFVHALLAACGARSRRAW